jgi:sulfur carrier protein
LNGKTLTLNGNTTIPTTMQILLNGEPLQLPGPIDVAGLLAHLNLGERRVAVEVNREIVPRSRHAGFALAEGDSVELVHAMGGG